MWEDVKMRVPALAPTNLGGACNIMKVQVILKKLQFHLKVLLQYELEFHVDPSGVGFDLVVTVPILVGSFDKVVVKKTKKYI